MCFSFLRFNFPFVQDALLLVSSKTKAPDSATSGTEKLAWLKPVPILEAISLPKFCKVLGFWKRYGIPVGFSALD